MKFYKFVNGNTAVIKNETVYSTAASNYGSKQQYDMVRRIQTGHFEGLIKYLINKKRLYVVTKDHKMPIVNSNGMKAIGKINEFDGVSISSPNKPWGKIARKVYDKANVEIMFNPFALITDATRNMATFIYKHPVIKNEDAARLMARSRLELRLSKNSRIRKEMPGVPGVVVFVDSNEFLQFITNKPFSWAGDGIVVTEHFLNSFKVKEVETGEYVDIPFPFKMQGVARSKGMTIAKVARNIEIRYNGITLPVDVIMNTQSGRKNMIANLVASGIRLRKYAGEEVDVIPAYDKDALKEIADKYGYVTAPVFVDGVKIGQAIVGIGKFYFDLTTRTKPRIAKAYISYPQVNAIQKLIGFRLNARVVKKDREEAFLKADETIDTLQQFTTYIENTKFEDEKIVAAEEVDLRMLAQLGMFDEKFVDLLVEIENTPRINGIEVVTQDVAEKLERLTEFIIPINLKGDVMKIPVIGNLVFEASSILNIEELDEEIYAVSMHMTNYIRLLKAILKLYTSPNPKYFNKVKDYVIERAEYMIISAMKQCVSDIDYAPSIRSIHITLKEGYGKFMVPRHKLAKLIKKPAENMAVAYNNGDEYIVFVVDPDGIEDIMNKAGIEKYKVQIVGLESLQEMLKHVKLDDVTIAGSVVRHPIIGAINFGEFEPANIDGIGVPADVAKKIDGDDDGDIPDAVPLLVILEKKKIDMYVSI